MKRNFWWIIIITSGLSACKSLNTNLKVSERPLPDKFSVASDSQSSATVDWRSFFGDSLLVNLIDTAIKGNLDLQIALQRIEASRAAARFSRAEMLPKGSIAAAGGVRKYGLYTMDGAGNASTDITPGRTVPVDLQDYFFAMQASWEVDVWGRLNNNRRAAGANFIADIEERNLVQSNLVADVAIAYYELIALDNELEILRLTVVKQEEALDVLKLQKDARRSNELAIQQFKALVLATQALERETRQKIVETENRINLLIGRYPSAVPRLRESLYDSMPVMMNAGVPSALLLNRPDLRKAEMELLSKKFELKAARAAFLPNINISAHFGYQAFQPDFLIITPQSMVYSAVGSLMAPIINMNGLKAQFRTAKAGQLTAMYRYQAVIINAFTEVVNSLSNLDNLDETVALRKEQTEILAQSVETSRELYKSARAGYLEVLFSQQSALMANLELVNVLKRRHMARVSMYKILGGGWR